MGAHISTDGVPMVLEDVSRTDVLLRQEGGIDIPPTVLNRSKDVDHNMKCFRLLYTGNSVKGPVVATAPDGSNRNPGSPRQVQRRPAAHTPRSTLSSSTRDNNNTNYYNSSFNGNNSNNNNDTILDPFSSSHVATESVDLTKPTKLRATDVYIVLHIQRHADYIDSKSNNNNNAGGSGRVCAHDARLYGEETVPSWCATCTDAFTPRGLSVAFSTDIGKPDFLSPRATPRANPSPGLMACTPRATAGVAGGSDYQYSIHLLTGKRAHPLVAAVAVLHALQLERRLLENSDLVRCLFVNANLAHASSLFGSSAVRGIEENRMLKWAQLTQPHSVAAISIDEVTFATCDLVAASGQQQTTLVESYQKNSILRYLHGARTASPRMSMPGSARFSRGSTPRGVTPRTSAGPASSYHGKPIAVPTVTTSSASPANAASQGGAEVPRLRFSFNATTAAADGHPVLLSPSSASIRHAPLSRGPAASQATPALSLPKRTQPPPPDHSSSNNAAAAARASSGPSSSPPTNGKQPPPQQHCGSSSKAVTAAVPPPPGLTNLRLSETLSHKRVNAAPPQDAQQDRVARLKLASPEATIVLPWLLVGGEEAAKDRRQLLEKGVTAVVNTVSFDIPNFHEDAFHYLSLNIFDSPDEPIFSLFPIVNRFVEEEYVERGGKVFIHCHQGVSRSCSLVIAYLMWRNGICYDKAYEVVRAQRNICSPNAGFYVNLLAWERQLSQPVLDKAYAYVPYSERFVFPFSFRLALSFRRKEHKDCISDDDIMNPAVQVIDEEKGICQVDPRLFYGFVLKGSGSEDSAPNTICYAGARCDQAIARQAIVAWTHFLTYGFYRGPEVRTCMNNKQQPMQFTPIMKRLVRMDRQVCGPALTDVTRHIKRSLFPIYISSKEDPAWSPLFLHKDLVFQFASDMAEDLRIRGAITGRKRTRDEEMRRLGHESPTSTTTTDAPRPQQQGDGHAGRGQSATTPRTQGGMPKIDISSSNSNNNRPSTSSGLHSKRVGSRADTSRTHEHAATGYVNPSPAQAPSSAPATAKLQLRQLHNEGTAVSPSASSPLPPPHVDIEVYSYPFDGAPITEPITVDDFEDDACYAIIVPTAAMQDGNGKGSNAAFVWIGCDVLSDVAESAVHLFMDNRTVPRAEDDEAYEDDELPSHTVRMGNGYELQGVSIMEVPQGDEPNELLLFL